MKKKAVVSSWKHRWPSLSWHGHICHITGPLCWESIGYCYNSNLVKMAPLSLYCITVMSWVRWRLKLLASRVFAQSFVQVQIKENTKAPHHWPWLGESTGDRWIPLTKGQWCEKCIHLVMSTWECCNWTNVDPDLWHHMASQGLNDIVNMLKCFDGY